MARTGFWPVGTLSGAPWQGKVKRYDMNANAGDFGPGDVMILDTNGKCDVVAANTAVNLLGVCVGVLPVVPPYPDGTLALAGSTTPNLAQKYSSGAGAALICVAPDAIYESCAVAGLTNANIGQTTNVSIATVNTTTGMSQHAIGVTNEIGTVGTVAQLKIIDIVHSADNSASTNTRALVVFNRHVFGQVQAGI